MQYISLNKVINNEVLECLPADVMLRVSTGSVGVQTLAEELL